MKRTAFLLAFVLALISIYPVLAYSGYPTFNITAVVKDDTVTIQGYNFPANDKFTVTMGAYGTRGVGGYVVETTSSGSGGSFSKTYKIPSKLAGSYRIAIRLESPTTGYYAYNWFYNNSTSSTPSKTPVPTSTYKGYPTFSISAVTKDKSVTIKGTNFPANDKFTVTMGAYGTAGIGGTLVGTQDSNAGGSLTATYTIPASLAGSYRIAIRLQSPTSGYYAYNWFYNNNAP
jgi:hypothetical protein